MNTYLQEAFNCVCENATLPETWYVCLMESAPFYGGPEEGGWYGRDLMVVSYKEYPTEDIAKAIAARIQTFANELQIESQKAYGQQCLRELEWLEARGLDADWLPEPDGPSTFYIVVTDTIPEAVYGQRGYS